MAGRTAVVTGGASAIGADAVSRLRSRGMRVVAADRNPAVEVMYEATKASSGSPAT
jgi:NAD(P)-dependent dehydrogenase (short-subunit alcohol dehydrogenase family)